MQDFMLDCGSFHEPGAFSKRVLHQLEKLIPYDQARLYFLNDNGAVYDEYLIGVKKQVTKQYHEHYSKIEEGRYSVTKRVKSFRNRNLKIEDCVEDWSENFEKDQFWVEHVRPQGIRYSFGSSLCDVHNTIKSVFVLDRLCDIRFSNDELETVSHVWKHLNNLHQNFYVEIEAGKENVSNKLMEEYPLTAREAEIAELMRRGVTPAHISEKLYISPTTVKKHLANIHTKLGVSTRQELVVKLLNY